jgi:hypothetical protein
MFHSKIFPQKTLNNSKTQEATTTCVLNTSFEALGSLSGAPECVGGDESPSWNGTGSPGVIENSVGWVWEVQTG